MDSIGGLRETEVKELAVNPLGMPLLSRVVTTVTPVMNVPKALRNSRRSVSSFIRSSRHHRNVRERAQARQMQSLGPVFA